MPSTSELQLIADAIQRSLLELRGKMPTVGGEDQKALVSLKETVEELERNTTLLRDKLKPRKGIKNHLACLKDLTSFFLSLLAFILSFLSLLFTYVWLKPDIQLVKGSAVEATWFPQTNELRLDFRITVANYGRRMDVVKWMQAQLSSLCTNSRPIFFSSRTGDFTLKTPTKIELSFPFTVADRSAMDVDASISQVLGTATHDSLFQKPNQSESSRILKLKVDLKTASGKDTATEFCFQVPDNVSAEIEAGTTKEISTTECRGGR